MQNRYLSIICYARVKLSGNFGIAIILITICIRIAFFPLANMSFKSMARMKLLQPEMARLKELHKEDKMKLQQEKSKELL